MGSKTPVDELDIELMKEKPKEMQKAFKELAASLAGMAKVLNLAERALGPAVRNEDLDAMEWEDLDVLQMHNSREVMKAVVVDLMQDLGGMIKVLGLCYHSLEKESDEKPTLFSGVRRTRVRGGKTKKPGKLVGCYYGE